MTMTVNNNCQHFGASNSNHLAQDSSTPQFHNPWSASSAPQAQNVYASSHRLDHRLGLDTKPPFPPIQSSDSAAASYGHIPIPALSTNPSLPDLLGTQNVLPGSRELLSPIRSIRSSGYSDSPYSNGPSPIHNYAPTPSPFGSMGYNNQASTRTFPWATHSRQISQPSIASSSSYEDNTERLQLPNALIDYHDRGPPPLISSRSFADQMDASRGMIAMSQDTTPRNVYGELVRVGSGSGDAYGFPSTHSSSSSISSGSNPATYFAHSVASSVSDYSNPGSDIESVPSRSLSRAGAYLNGSIPPKSMMGQFSSKVSPSAAKKHKCKICDKRFTRPSSLQTHIYSHTGEKPFVCEVEGCGRHFSVVSNLRRHRKVHRGDARSEAGSSDHPSPYDEEE